MGAYSGKTGSATLTSGAVADVTKWDAEDGGDITVFGSSDSDGWKKRVSGTDDLTGTIEAMLQAGSAPPRKGDTSDVTLVSGTGGLTISGPIMFEKVSVECDINTGAAVGFKASFGANGQISFAGS